MRDQRQNEQSMNMNKVHASPPSSCKFIYLHLPTLDGARETSQHHSCEVLSSGEHECLDQDFVVICQTRQHVGLTQKNTFNWSKMTDFSILETFGEIQLKIPFSQQPFWKEVAA